MVLHVDDDAYELLRNYLDQIQLRFSQVPGESEILNDIETRMAELFQEKLVPGKEVINLEDAKEVIAIMGKPEEIGEDQTEEAGPAMPPPPYRGRGRRMYRDPSNQKIGGVCSGLAAYFRVDPLLVRILFVVFFLAYGSGILVYLVLWAAVPLARTSAEKLEMYGEPVNVYNIERQVRQEYPYDPDMPADQQQARRYTGETVIGRMMRALGTVILVFFKIIGFIIAFSFIIAGIAILGSIIGLAVSGKAWFIHSDWNLGSIGLGEAAQFFVSPTAATIGVIGLILLVAIPVIGLIYGVVKAIFRFKARDRVGAAGLSGLWVVILIVLIVLGINEGVQYSVEGRTRENKELIVPASRKLIVKANPNPSEVEDRMAEFNFHSEFWISRQNDSVSLLIRPQVTIECSDDSIAGILIRKTARGANLREATNYADDITYTFSQQDSVISMDPLYRLYQRSRYHAQQVNVTIDLPAGTVVYLDRSMKDLLYSVRNAEDTWSGDLVGDSWIMTPDGLTRMIKQEDLRK